MLQGEWNLQLFPDPISIFIAVCDEEDPSPEDNIPLRLLLLSHQFAYHGVPAFYLEKCPNVPFFANQHLTDKKFVILFDLFDKIADLEIPDWVSLTKHIWELPQMYNQHFVYLFQRCITLYYLYKLIDFKPIYFTTFLYFEEDPFYPLQSFFVRFCPVLHENQLGIRTLIQNDKNTTIFGNSSVLQRGRSILLSPYDWPFTVVSVSGNTLTLQSIDTSIVRADLKKAKFVILTKFSKSFFRENVTVKPKTTLPKPKCSFQKITSFKFTENEWTDFFHSHFFLSEEDSSNQKKKENQSIIEDTPSTAYDFLTEQCEACYSKSYYATLGTRQEKRMAARDQIKKIYSIVGDDNSFPPNMHMVLPKISRALSTLELNITFPSPQLTKHSPQILGEVSGFEYQQVPIPQLSVVQDESVTSIPANSVLEDWVENRRAPLQGEKDLHYIIFTDESVSSSAAQDFAQIISESYCKYRLGKLKPISSDITRSFPSDQLEDRVLRYLNENKTFDFHKEPEVLFIFTDLNFEDKLSAYSLFIQSKWVKSPVETVYDSLAFRLYTKVRVFNSTPYGSFDLTEQKKGIYEAVDKSKITLETNLFFGMRFSPPYALPVTPEIRMHLAVLVRENEFVVVVTDSTVQTLDQFHIKEIAHLHELIKGLSSFTNNETVVTIFSDGLNESIFEKLKSALSDLQVIFVTLHTLCYIQTNVKTDNDFVVTTSEVPFFPGTAQPSARCVVCSGSLQSYTLGIYDNSLDTLISIAYEFSAMSWVSIKPGMEKRTYSLPPHIAGLFSIHHIDLSILTPFNFLTHPLLE